MIALLFFLLKQLVLPSKPKPQLEAENAALTRQVAILQREVRGRVRLTNSDRLFFVLLYRWFPSILMAMAIERLPNEENEPRRRRRKAQQDRSNNQGAIA
jgi:hypothetical protein